MNVKNLNVYFFFIVLIVASIGVYILFAPYLSAIFVAALLAVMYIHPYHALVRGLRGHTAIASFIMCIAVALTIVLPIVGIGGLVAKEVSHIVIQVSKEDSSERATIVKFSQHVRTMPLAQVIQTQANASSTGDNLTKIIQSIAQKALPLLTKAYQNIVSAIIWIFVMFFALFYFFMDGGRFVERIMDMSPLRNKHESMLIERFVSMARATLKGTLVIGSIQGVMGGIAFIIAGVASPILWTVLMIFLSIIPAVGAGLIIFPVGVVMFSLGFVWEGIFLLGTGVVVSVIDNILRPKLVGKDTQMHSLLIFFATLGGMSVFGLVGFVIGPIIMALGIALWEIYALEFKKELKQFNA